MGKQEIYELERLATAYRRFDQALYHMGEAAKVNPEAVALKERLVSLMDDVAELMRDVRREV